MPDQVHGFVLGKFMPPHLGHIFLCETAIRMADVATVLVCSTDEEPIPGKLRFQWMSDALPRARVLHLHRNLPQEPADHPAFWKLWKEAIQEHHPEPIDLVFGSEEYIFQLADVLQAKAVIIDPDRMIFPFSGSAARADIDGNWDTLPAAVRAHYARRICLLGPECSGKSVLTRTLADIYQTRFMPEYGRTYDETYKQTKPGPRQWIGADLVDLARTHVAMCQTLMPHANRVLFEDTDPLQTAIWERHLLGRDSAEMSDLIARYQPADFYLILSPNVPFKDDGGRYFPEQSARERFFQEATALVEARDLPYAVISESDWQKREAAALKAVAAHLGF